jgi:7,8-dihydropterin-6-yl-methyl-4-(beta-D-ribofuranosyl)aminobenzene 5'-phosphate synthase
MRSSSIRLTVVVENGAARPGLGAEHGLAVLVESPRGAVLFDAGASGLVLENAAALGLNLPAVSAVALSHGHNDHTGGLSAVLERLSAEVAVYAHPAAMQRKYVRRAGKPVRSIGIPEVPGGSRMRLSAEPREIIPGVTLLGQVPRSTAYEDTGGPFFLDAEGRRPDFLADDTSLLVRTAAGHVLVCGCAHAGIVNTLRHASELIGGRHFAAVLGGMHLGGASAHRLKRTVEDLGEFEIDAILPGHCSGEAIWAALRETRGERCRPCPAGTALEFPAAGSGRRD